MTEFQAYTNAVEECWHKELNYCVQDYNISNKRCLVCFSSNGLYVTNTAAVFKEKIIKDERYEYKNVTNHKRVHNKFGRIIFVRDVWKAWYARGINEQEDSIDKLLIKLSELTDGYQVVTVGNSAGGYMAVIAGIHLKAEKVLCFSGQFKLEMAWRKDILEKYKEDSGRSKYYDITELIKQSDTQIIYFYPAKSEPDIQQAEKIKDYDNVIRFPFDYTTHAQTVAPYNYKFLFEISPERYRKISCMLHGRRVKATEFLIITGKVSGLGDCLKGAFQLFKKSILKKKIDLEL